MGEKSSYSAICSASSMLLDFTLVVLAAAVWACAMFVDVEDTAAESSTNKLLILSILVMAPIVLAALIKVCMTKPDFDELLDNHDDKESQRQEQSLFWNFFDHPLPLDHYQNHKDELEAFCRDHLRFRNRTVLILVAPAMSLFSLCVVRLFLGVTAYGANPRELDFGFLDGMSTSSEKAGFATKIVAFESEIMTFIVAIMGFISAFLSFPVVSGFLSWMLVSWREARCCARVFCGGLQLVIHLAPWLLTLYPAYLVLWAFFDDDDIATSQIWADFMEWSYSFLIGLSVGRLANEIAICYNVRRLLISQRKEDEEVDTDSSDEEQSNGQHSEKGELKHITMPTYPSLPTQILQTIMGLCLSGTVVFSAWESAATWISSEDIEASTLFSYDVSSLIPAFLVIPCLICVCSLLVMRKRS